MSEQQINFSEFNRPTKPFTIGISENNNEWFYVFSSYVNKEYTILLMKSFEDEKRFIEEIVTLSKIFECSIYSDTFDLKKLNIHERS